MAFRSKPTQEEQQAATDVVNELFELIHGAEANEAWDPNDESQVDDDTTPRQGLTAKLDTVMHNTLDQLIDGSIRVENAQELIATIQAVDNHLRLKRSGQ